MRSLHPVMLLTFAILVLPGATRAQTNPSAMQKNKEDFSVSLIDRFFVPASAKSEFYERMRINRSFIRTLPGFIRDEVYEAEDEKGNLNCVTIASWNGMEAIVKAKEAVQAEYHKEGFDMPAMLKRLDIVIDRGVYRELPN